MIRRVFALILLTCVVPALAAEKPVPQIDHAIIISVDGLRPDLLLRADTPRMHQLIDEGAFTMWAKTTPSSITLPSHVSMLTGVTPEVHGVLWNADLPLSKPLYPAAPTIFEVVNGAGMSTAMAAGKSKFDVLNRPGTIDWCFISQQEAGGNEEVTAHAVQFIKEHKPNLLFVHFPIVDGVGHASGWGSPQQMQAIATTDRDIGTVLDAMKDAGLADSTFVIVTSDHGGAGRTHGPEDPRSRSIPWIASGPGIRKNFDLTRLPGDFNVETYDTFTTTCMMLGAPITRHVTGKFIPQILNKQELVLPARDGDMAPSTQPSSGQ